MWINKELFIICLHLYVILFNYRLLILMFGKTKWRSICFYNIQDKKQ